MQLFCFVFATRQMRQGGSIASIASIASSAIIYAATAHTLGEHYASKMAAQNLSLQMRCKFQGFHVGARMLRETASLRLRSGRACAGREQPAAGAGARGHGQRARCGVACGRAHVRGRASAGSQGAGPRRRCVFKTPPGMFRMSKDRPLRSPLAVQPAVLVSGRAVGSSALPRRRGAGRGQCCRFQTRLLFTMGPVLPSRPVCGAFRHLWPCSSAGRGRRVGARDVLRCGARAQHLRGAGRSRRRRGARRAGGAAGAAAAWAPRRMV